MTAIEFNHQLLDLQQGLKRFALKLTTNSEEAQDLMQETFLKALSHRDKFAEYTNLKAWVYTIMKNTFINNYRRRIKENTTIDSTKDLYYLNLSKDTKEDIPDKVLSFKEISGHIERLDDNFKVPFKMHVDGFKYKEIADELGLKIGTVKSRIFFTRKKLMEKLEDYQTI